MSICYFISVISIISSWEIMLIGVSIVWKQLCFYLLWRYCLMMASCFILSFKSRWIHAELDQPVFHDLSNLQIEYLQNIHLIRGNHEAADINAVFGFRIECIERLVFLLTLSLSLSLSFFSWKKKVSVDYIAAIYVPYFFNRVSEMVFGLGIVSTSCLIGFLWLLWLKRKLSACMEALVGL